MADEQWPALESNPDCFTELLQGLDVDSVIMKDVFAFEKDAYHGARPYALLLCFSNYENAKKILDNQYVEALAQGLEHPKDIFIVKQNFGNSCAAFALLNALANLEGRIDLGQGLFMQWLTKAKGASEAERSLLVRRGWKCGKKTLDKRLQQLVERAAEKGVTPQEEKVNNHFVTFLYKGGVIYEIDSCGLMARAVEKTTEDNFIVDCGHVIQKYVKQLGSEEFYSVLALLPKD